MKLNCKPKDEVQLPSAPILAIPVLAEGTGVNVFTYKGAGWVKEANKLGTYKKTYQGFRIYTVIAATFTTTIVEKEDGIMYNKTEFTKGRYIAIDKFGVKYKGWYWSIISKIDYDVMQQFYSK